MSERERRGLALSVTGLALAAVAVLFADGVGTVVQYGFFALALAIGLAGVWALQRETDPE